jgi:hypothetical protein
LEGLVTAQVDRKFSSPSSKSSRSVVREFAYIQKLGIVKFEFAPTPPSEFSPAAYGVRDPETASAKKASARRRRDQPCLNHNSPFRQPEAIPAPGATEHIVVSADRYTWVGDSYGYAHQLPALDDACGEMMWQPKSRNRSAKLPTAIWVPG